MAARGYYVVVFVLEEGFSGKLGGRGVELEPGVYAYVGSAFGPGGLAARLRRHLCGARRRLWWHIDRLLSSRGARVVGAFACPLGMRGLEGLLAAAGYASRCIESVGPRLGGSDDPYGFSHVFRCLGNVEECLCCALAMVSALPCMPAWLVCSQLLRGP